ncbi:ABC transporter ATP-binding protein [Candidatus Dojkabacteria bacterium]|nr:ABC transporter ATP-binding protein [Candidatus Dojkabacteria bacterium]
MSKKKPLSFKDYIDISLWSLKINWQMSKFVTVATFVTTIYRNLTALVNTYLMARIIDQLIDLVGSSDPQISNIYPLLVIMGGVKLIEIAVNNLDSYLNRYRRRFSMSYLMQLEYEKIMELGVQTNQLPSVSNKRQVTHDWIYNIVDVNQGIVRIVASFVQSVSAAIIVFSFSSWIGIAVLVISVIAYLQSRYFFRKDFEWQTSEKNIQERRKTWYISDILSNPDTMDEVSLVGAFKYLDRKVKSFYNFYNEGYKKILRLDSATTFGVDLLNLFVIIGGTIHVFILAIQKVISVGDTTFYVGAINSFYGGVSWFSAELVMFGDMVMKEREVYEFFNLKPSVEDGSIRLERLINPPSIELKGVTFHYPNSKREIFKNFSMKIASGEKIAIVGENGAGKSTLVKLLCRIYDPQEGVILINGTNLKDLTLNDWYKNVGVLFQDFNFYGNLTVEENIYIGKSVKQLDKERVVESAKNADAHDFIQKYKKGYQTIMSERFKDGIKPSKGQQQKIAIARFFYRDAPFAIFDEPTSAIDADAEYRIFNRIYNFFDNKTVLIISHRFSTVRNADRIIVLRDGKVIEEGSHKELMKLNGVYTDNFKKQAEGYN